MATKIVTKNSSTAGSAPLASDLVQGELAVNVTDKRLYTENASGGIVEVGSNPYNFTANHDGSAKLATTATGIDVTGTATMDGLTVDGTANFNTNNIIHTALTPTYVLSESDVTDNNTQFLQASGTLRIRTVNDAGSNIAERMRIDHGTGDISFYEDTGTTPKFFWDASAESLGIGTTSPKSLLDIASDKQSIITLSGTTNNASGDLLGGINFYNADGSTNGPNNAASIKAVAATSLGADADLIFSTKRGASSGDDALEAMRIDSNGNVGIGTDSPLNTLHVAGTMRYDGRLLTNSTTSDGSAAAPSIVVGYDYDTGFFRPGADTIGFATGGAERMRIDSSGRVSIKNEAAPTLRIENTDTSLTANQTIGDIDFYQTDPSGTGVGVVSKIRSINSSTFQGEAGLAFHTGTSSGLTERMRIDSSGRVGIGTSSPTRPLTVNGDNGAGMIVNDATNDKALRFRATGDAFFIEATNNAESAYANLALQGNVGIGTSSPTKELVVNQNSAECVVLVKSSDTGVAGIYLGGQTDEIKGGLVFNNSDNSLQLRGYNNAERMRIDSSGHLLHGTTTTTPTAGGTSLLAGTASLLTQSHAAGTSPFGSFQQYKYNSSVIGSVSRNGNTGVFFVTTSDGRLKENVRDSDDAGSKIDAIQVRQYDWKADGSHQDYGMIAQELQAVAPEAVSGDADSEEMMGVDYSKLVPMLIKEIQSLRNRVAQLEGI